jgi:hypothetical protein
MQQQLCSNSWSKSKVRYKTRAQAEKNARRSKCGLALHVYPCRYCNGWHLSSEAPLHKTETPVSAAKLRRKLANASAQILAHQRRLDEADAAQRKAEEALRRADAAASDERAWVTRELNRLFGSAK